MFNRIKQSIYQYERLLFPCGFSNHTQAAIFSFFEKERKLIDDNIRDFVPLDEEKQQNQFLLTAPKQKEAHTFLTHFLGEKSFQM